MADEDFIPKSEYTLNMLDGDVQSQGIKLNHREWLDLGSKDWTNVPDKVKSAAWQAAKLRGWDKTPIKNAMMEQYKHIKESMMNLVFEELESLVKKYPFEIEDLSAAGDNHDSSNKDCKVDFC